MGLPYQIAGDADTSLTAAASMSANFPPIFSNALVKVRADDGIRRFWVTDGGSVDNRGLISLLLALKSQLAETEPSPSLAPLKILVAEASGLSGLQYKEDRGLGAVGGSKAKIASQLISELYQDVNATYLELSGKSIEIIYLPMPTALREAFGTHWQMPRSIDLHDPDDWWKRDRWWWYDDELDEDNWLRNDIPEIQLETAEILDVLDLVFATDEERRALRIKSKDAEDLWDWLDKDWKEPLRKFDLCVQRRPRQ